MASARLQRPFKLSGSTEFGCGPLPDILKVAGGKERIRHYVEAYAPPGGAMALAKLSALHADKTARYAIPSRRVKCGEARRQKARDASP